MEIENRISVKSRLLEQVNDYLLSLHDVNEVSKRNYGACFKSFVQYLEEKGINSFEDVSKTILGQFLSTKKGSKHKNPLHLRN